MVDRVQQAADAVSAVSGSTPAEAKRALSEWPVRDQVAGLAAAGGGGGGSAGIELIGPFAATFQSPQIGGNGYLLTTLDPSQIIFAVYVFVSSSWANDGGLYIYLGDPNVNPINLWVNAGAKNTSYASIPPADGGLAAGIAADQSFATDSGIYIQCSNTVSAGASDIYLLVSTPT